MKLAVFGATGGTGRAIITQAIERGHDVVALARRPGALSSKPSLQVVLGDACDRAAVDAVVSGAEAVLVALGVGRNVRDKSRVLTTGTSHIVAAMTQYRVARVVCETSVMIGEARRGMSLAGRAMLHVMSAWAPGFLSDKERQESTIRGSALEWTLVRPVTLDDGPLSGDIEAAEVVRATWSSRISRADVARFMLDQLEGEEWLRQCVAIKRRGT